MELIISSLLAFGNVTVTVLVLLVLLVVLAGVYQLGIFFVSVLLALDCEDAPDIKINNSICKYLIAPLSRGKIIRDGKLYNVKVLNGKFYDSTRPFQPLREPDKDCRFTEGAAHYYAAMVGLPSTIGMLIALDMVILALQHQFFYTTIALSIITVVYGVRTLAKKVYKNTKNIVVHEEKIVKLEGEK